jgi:hypothetical protein
MSPTNSGRDGSPRSFRDPNTLYRADAVVGEITNLTIDGNRILIEGVVDVPKCKKHDLESVLVLDKSGRFVSMGEIALGRWEVSVSSVSLGKDNSALSFACYATGASHNFIYAIRQETHFEEAYARHVGDWLPDGSQDVPSISAALRDLIATGVSVPYVARSIHDGIKTGNSYQTLSLGAGRRTSGRTDRLSLLSKVVFHNRSVLDIGANTGEMSRSARVLGARLVDGYEYDPYFVELGRAVNAVRGTTRVSLFQGDCTNPALYSNMGYDMILALNVWVYVDSVIPLFPAIAPVMVFETHTLDRGMNWYYERVTRYFPFAACLGLTDVGGDPHSSRAFIAFATTKEWLETSIIREFVRVEPYFRNPFLERHGVLDEPGVRNLAAKCFATPPTNLWNDHESYSFGREGYFEILLAGLHQFTLEKGVVSDDNIYCRLLIEGVSAGFLDPQLSGLMDDRRQVKRKVANKFEDMVNIISGSADRVPPIKLVRDDVSGPLRFTTFGGEVVRCSEIDGHHRFFSSQLMGLKQIHCAIT